MSAKMKAHIIFQGHVQGVGFRYTVQYYSHRHAVSGYVRNLIDGNVEVVAEGEKSELEAFLSSILKSPLKKHIHNHSVSWSDALDLYDGFKIAY